MALFFEADIYTDEGVIPETSDNFTLKFGTRNKHFSVLIISYEYHAAKTYFVTYLRDLVFEIVRFSWHFGRCSWFSGGCSWFSGEVFRVFWGVFRVLGGVPGFWVFRDVPGCSGVPGSTTCHKQRFGKMATTVLLEKDENSLIFYMKIRHYK